MTKTTLPELPNNDSRKWYIIDAADKPLGRLAVRVANALRGKDRADFAPSVDTGAFVIVINAAKVALTGKKNEQKQYVDFTGWRGGQTKTPASVIRERNPERLITHAEEQHRRHPHDAPESVRRRRAPPRGPEA